MNDRPNHARKPRKGEAAVDAPSADVPLPAGRALRGGPQGRRCTVRRRLRRRVRPRAAARARRLRRSRTIWASVALARPWPRALRLVGDAARVRQNATTPADDDEEDDGGRRRGRRRTTARRTTTRRTTTQRQCAIGGGGAFAETGSAEERQRFASCQGGKRADRPRTPPWLT